MKSLNPIVAAELAKTIPLKIMRIHPDAVLPKYAKPGDAGMDLTVIDDGKPVFPLDSPHASFLYLEYQTGLIMEIPEGYVGLIFPRSSQSNTGLILANCVGVIDSGYRGPVSFRFKVDGAATYLEGVKGLKRYVKGDRAGQLIIMPVPAVRIEEVKAVSQTERGTGGFGSTG